MAGVPSEIPFIDRVMARIDRSGGEDVCHIWLGGVGQKEIPTCAGPGGTTHSARRIVWEAVHGTKLNRRQWVRPSCGTKRCLNPKHLIVRDLDPAVRFWTYVDKSAGPDACWPWTGGAQKHRWGYGEFHVQAGPKAIERKVRTNRYVLELVNGEPVPDHLVVMHLCDNPVCVNPAHLRIGTQRENHEDMVSKGRHPIIKAAREREAARLSFSEGDKP